MTEFKAGDVVRVIKLIEDDKADGVVKGAEYILDNVGCLGLLHIRGDGIKPSITSRDGTYPMHADQCELVSHAVPPEWNGRVTVDGKEYEIVWQHERYDDVRDQEVLQHPDRAITDCQIIKDVAGYGIGHSHCSWSDNFSRKVGRKLSLQRALENSNFNYAQRQQVWEQVLAVKGLVK